MSSNPLTPSFRTVHRIPQNAADESVRKAVRDHDQSITDINQAISVQASKISSLESKTASTTTIIENINSSGSSPNWTTLGTVNNQLGNPAYTTQQGDDGAKIIAGDSTSVSITLNPTVSLPWFTVIGNDSTSSVALSAGSPASLSGVLNISPGCYVLVYYDGSTFWSEGIQWATDSTCGIVKPDNITTNIDSTNGALYTQVQVGGGAPSGAPATPGNPFYFDSTASPWNGYVYALGSWNRFS